MSTEEPARPVVVLVGPPGAGKTEVGTLLAKRLGVAFHDTDHAVEAIAGKPVSDVFVEDGEAAFRALEKDAVITALREQTGVVALGGGAVESAAIRAALRGHRVVFLDIRLAAAVRRVGLGVSRPLLLGNVRGQLKRLLDQRHPHYTEVAQDIVATDDRTVEQVADAVAEVLGEQ